MDRPADKENIVLIGMPGAGKSTVGVLLAKALSKRFIDTDLLIQEAAGERLQDIIDERGLEAFLAMEERTVCGLDCSNAVIATGGSVIYSRKAMTHLHDAGVVVFLHLSLGELLRRVTNMDSRGIAIGPGQTFEGLYEDRLPLYKAAADITIDSDGPSHEGAVLAVVSALQSTDFSTRKSRS